MKYDSCKIPLHRQPPSNADSNIGISEFKRRQSKLRLNYDTVGGKFNEHISQYPLRHPSFSDEIRVFAVMTIITQLYIKSYLHMRLNGCITTPAYRKCNNYRGIEQNETRFE